ncbi:MAG: right-handed parallel beta-helix repeat-containing protein [Kiritimatiellaceae bacterium]|nr:right-handed parallel beta-helix repeat-containing protein [Kiritimatiellaceae bacterium]
MLHAQALRDCRIVSLCFVLMGTTGYGADFYVSPSGDDAGAGTLAQPFASIQRAQAAVRDLKAKKPTGEITIELRGGLYEMDKPVEFRPEDSGRADQPVIYRAFPGEEPIFSGARPIRGWRKADMPVEGVNRLAAGKLWTTTVEKGWSFPYLYIHGKAYYRSVWPNTDLWKEWPLARCEGELLTLPAEFHFRLPNRRDVQINYMPTPHSKWINLFNTVTEMKAGVIHLQKPVLQIGILKPTEQVPFRIENTLEGIDRPGEWCVNTETGVIYLWPAENTASNFTEQVCARQLDKAFILSGDSSAGRKVEYLTVEGISIQYVNTGISLTAAKNCTIRACRIESVDAIGVSAADIQNVAIEHCLIANCGKSGLSIAVTDKEPELALQNTKNRIEHNELYNCGQMHWQSSAISVMTDCSLIRYNYIHDVPYAGITVNGQRFYILKTELANAGKTTEGIAESDMTIYGLKRYVPGHNRIENNVVHDAMMQLDDGGAIYCHASHHNLLKNNIVYRLHGSYGIGLYFDDDEMFSTMENNLIFTRDGDPVPRFAIHVHANACNYVFRNIVAFGAKPISTPRSYGGHVIAQNVFLLKADGLDQGDLSRNSGRYKDLKWDAGQPVMDNNLYWSSDDGKQASAYLSGRQGKGFDTHSTVADPGFSEARKGRFGFDTTSPVWQMGIEPIDTSEVGIFSDCKAVDKKTRGGNVDFFMKPVADGEKR